MVIVIRKGRQVEEGEAAGLKVKFTVRRYCRCVPARKTMIETVATHKCAIHTLNRRRVPRADPRIVERRPVQE